MDVYQAILKRRTIRRFQQKPITDKILEKLVNAGRLAPSAANLQPLEYIVVDKPSLVKKVFPALSWAGYIAPRGNPPLEERPVAYIVILINKNKTTMSGTQDAAAAIENIILTALEEGIGSCWIVSVEKKTLGKKLGVPEHCYLDSVIALGYPQEEPVLEEIKDSVEYWKDKQGTLHVPKRKTTDILHRNRY